jgi:hypothetical protein
MDFEVTPRYLENLLAFPKDGIKVPPKYHKSTNPHGIIPLKTGIFTSTAVRISDVKSFLPCVHVFNVWYSGKETVFMFYFGVAGVCLMCLS